MGPSSQPGPVNQIAANGMVLSVRMGRLMVQLLEECEG
jgi:hypothetical protein